MYPVYARAKSTLLGNVGILRQELGELVIVAIESWTRCVSKIVFGFAGELELKMRWYQRPTVAGVVVALGITGAVWFTRLRSSPQSPGTQRIEVVGTRISPYEGDAVIEAERGTSITVRYSLRNQSATVLTDLVAKPGCRCQIIDSLPSRLEPGQEATVSLQMGVPEGGTKEWSVPITCSG